MSNSELQALLANLRPRSQALVSNASRDQSREVSTSYPSTSQAPFTSPLSPSLQPPPSAAPTNNVNPVARNLLNLLNFNSTNAADVIHAPQNGSITPRSTSRADYQQGSISRGSTPAMHPTAQNAHLRVRSRSGSPQVSLQDLSRHAFPVSPISQAGQSESANPQQQDVESQQSHNAVQSTSEGITAVTPSHHDIHNLLSKPTHIEPISSKPLFTYKNPFEALKASRSQNGLPPQPQAVNQEPVAAPLTVPYQAGMDPQTLQEELNNSVPDRIKLTPKSRAAKANTQEVDAKARTATPDISTVSLTYETPQTLNQDADFVDAMQTDDTSIKLPALKDSPLDPAKDSRIVPVMSFPVKAFVSISLQLSAPATSMVRTDGVMEISRLKKDFDQVDRSLSAASSMYITYAFVKDGGMRIIRQEDGSDRHVFKHSHDRIFNVTMCTSSLHEPTQNQQAIVGTGVSGAVYYATLTNAQADFFNDNNLDAGSLVFPAHPQADENTAGGVLKTRAKRSSKNPDFFAIGRGKFINIIWPSAIPREQYTSSEHGHTIVDTEKLFQERPLQISTGKAGKDFTFSEDDTAIVSLDKTGRLRFWDTRKLIDQENAYASHPMAHIIDTPIHSLATASPTEKSRPTSVLFVDKIRPYTKGGALRYVLVGLRQNHTLQLWDIALGKAVQEVNFPHESETDGICSVSYHPATGIVVVGHPTRNSLFFVHLSVPRYTLSSTLSQASYIQRVAARDPDIPKPESTACMSGIREISFADRGQLRSVELLPVHKSADEEKPSTGSDTLFELYVVHSKGVTCLAIDHRDLGWNSDRKPVHIIDAEKEGLVSMKELKLGSVIETGSQEKSPVAELAQPVMSTKKKSKKAKEQIQDTAELPALQEVSTNVPEVTMQEPIVPAGAEAESADHKETSKKSKKKKNAKVESMLPAPEKLHENSQAGASALAMAQTDGINTSTTSKGPDLPEASTASTTAQQRGQGIVDISGDWIEAELKRAESAIAAEIKKELDGLYANFKDDRAIEDQAANSRQEAVLRVVSSTLNSNVEKSLTSIIGTQLKDIVLPRLSESVPADVAKIVSQSVRGFMPEVMSDVLPKIVENSLQASTFLDSLVDRIDRQLRDSITKDIEAVLKGSLVPAIQATITAHTTSADQTEQKLLQQIEQLRSERQSDLSKIDELQRTLQLVIQKLQDVSESQMSFQQEVIKHLTSSNAQPGVTPSDVATAAPANASDETTHSGINSSCTQDDLEIEEITQLMEQRRYEEGSIKWLQSSQTGRLFDELFVRFTPEYLATDVSPLVAFSVGVTVANTMEKNTMQRLEWIEAAFDSVDFNDREITELAQHAPQLLNSLIHKLENLYTSRVGQANQGPILHILLQLIHKARALHVAFQTFAVSNIRG